VGQGVHDPPGELAVLKTIGFSSTSVLAMVLAESVLLLVLGGVIGILLATPVIPLISHGSNGMLSLAPVGAGSWALGLSLMLAIGVLVGALPAWSAMRLNIVDALARR
jgi:putative ABC transport system permease protein